MLGFVVNFFLRMIRTQVTASAVLPYAGLGSREVMAHVAGGAGPAGSVGIDSPYPRVGPIHA
jgi:hypothetical protein